jgi:hypothetical protein
MATPQIDFRPYLSITGVYDTGLAGIAVKDASGALADTSSYGIEAAGGVSGTHSWRHTKVGLDYHAAIRHYTQQTYYDGVDQSLLLGVTHQLSRHVAFTLRQSAGIFSRAYGALGLAQAVPFDPLTSYIPTTDFFDNRTVYLSTQADLSVQKSARLSFGLGGDGFLTRRRSTALYGVAGGSARGDVQYRLSRRSTIGVGYNFTHFQFNHIFSSTDMHGATVTYAIRLTRDLEFSGYAGFVRAETKFEQSVPVDPVIAALLGITSLPRVVHDIAWQPNISARLSQTFRRGVFYVSGGHTVTPGNGLFLTSYATNAGGGYSYTGLRRWSFSAGVAYNRSQSIGNLVGEYASTVGSFAVSRQVGRSVHLIANFDARQYQSGDFSNYNRLIYSARLGFGFTPGNVPLRVW